MTIEIAITFVIIVGIMAMFIWNRLRYDLVAMLGLVVAIACGVVPAEKAFTGFADQVVIIVASALVVSASIGKSTVIERMVRRLQPLMLTTGRQVVVLTVCVTVLSSFMKNIGALAIFVPIAVQVAQRTGTSVSKLLMPMAFGSLIGGVVTLIGTSPNILVARVRDEILGQPFRMFDFTPVGLGIMAAGLVFLAIGWRLLPGDRRGRASAEEAFKIEPYVFEARLPAASPIADKTVADLEALSDGEIAVTAVVRDNGETRYVPAEHWVLFADDLLVIQGDAPALRRIVEAAKLEIGGSETAHEAPEHISVVEAVVMGDSRMVGSSAAELRLRTHYGLSLLAISRRGQDIRTHLRHVRFRPGDVLVLQGDSEEVLESMKTLGCLPLVNRATGLGRRPQEYLPLGLVGIAMLLVAFEVVPVTVAFFGAAVLTVALRILSLEEAYNALDLPILVLLACLIPISDAISATGGAELIARGLAVAAGALPPVGAMTMVLVAAMALTPFLNNAATALIMGPVAASLAIQLGLSAEPFLMAVAIGAACDFLTPIGHQCNTLVMGPGGYRFGDYWKLGLPLSIIVIVVGTILIPIVWPLR